jgi:hypothetical protein
MTESNQASDSSNPPGIRGSGNDCVSAGSGLEKIAQQEPLPDTSLVIVHVNRHYGSVECCKEPIQKLLDARVASHVYEHSTDHESFLQNKLGFIPEGRYSDFELDGVNYHIVDNETDPGNYQIEGLQGEKVIIVGGGISHCHKKATEAVVAQLLAQKPTRSIEIHLPGDCIYQCREGGREGERELVGYIPHDYRALGKYSQIMPQTGKGYAASFNGRLLTPKLHLAVWSSSAHMLEYLRNDEKLREAV